MATETRNRKRHARRGFTLVEMLTVIVIISILAALITPAVLGAMKAAKLAAIKMEITNLQTALQQYATDMGEFPPDFSQTGPNSWQQKQAAINAHLSRAYRNRNLFKPYTDATQPGDLLTQADLEALNPTNALYFWLKGFSPDPQRPLTGAGDRKARYDFQQPQLRAEATSAYAVYYAPGADKQQLPYIYYRANKSMPKQEYQLADVWSYDLQQNKQRSIALPSGNEVDLPRPYFARTNSQLPVGYAEPQKFQIICAGLDGSYGLGGISAQAKPPIVPVTGPENALNPLQAVSGIFPEGPYASPDRDNITNFTTNSTLEDSQP